MGGEGEGEQRGKGRVDMHTGKQAVRLEKKKIPTGENRRSKRAIGERRLRLC